MNKKILVVVAHRDDEVLGVGGTLRRHYEEGDEVNCLYLGTGELCRESGDMNFYAKESAKVLGIKGLYFENFPDNKFDSVPLLDIAKKIEGYLERLKPEIVYTHYENDLNIDHRRVFQAVITAGRPCNDNYPKEIYSFEVLSSTEWQLEGAKFSPNVYVDIEETIETKLRAMEIYKSELRDYPHSRSLDGIKILSQYRGLECGRRYAEAFRVIRRIE